MPFYGNECIQTWVITALDEHFERLDDDEKIEMMDLFRDDEGWFDDDKWGKIVWDNYEDMLMEGINNDMLITAIKHSFLNEEEYEWELHSHMRGVFEEWREENLTKKTEEDEEPCGCGNCERCLADDTCVAGCGDRGTVTVTDQNDKECLVCRDCRDYFKKIEGYMAEQKAFEAEEETCVKCKETKTEDWYYNTTDVKNAPVCEDCRDKDEAEEAEKKVNLTIGA